MISHAISRCDTVSATFGMGKLKAFNKFKESSYWRSAIKTLCDDDIEIDRMVELGEKFHINLYGKVAAKAKSLDQVREIIYSLPKYIPITGMSPTNRSFYFHMLRTYLQINTWKHLRQLLGLVIWFFQWWKRQHHSDHYWQRTCVEIHALGNEVLLLETK